MGARDQVRIIGITATKRVADAPEFPTLKEQSGVSCSDSKRRAVINFNYIENIR